MARIVLTVFGVLVVTAAAQAQTPAEVIEQAISRSPLRFPGQATIIKWNPDHTYEVIRKGTNTLVCYDRSDERNRSPFAAQCTNMANLPRAAQNRRFRFETSTVEEENAAIAAAEAAGTRVKPEFGSLWFRMDGANVERGLLHMTIAVPGATGSSLGLPENGAAGGAWVMEAGTSAAHIMVPGR